MNTVQSYSVSIGLKLMGSEQKLKSHSTAVSANYRISVPLSHHITGNLYQYLHLGHNISMHVFL